MCHVKCDCMECEVLVFILIDPGDSLGKKMTLFYVLFATLVRPG